MPLSRVHSTYTPFFECKNQQGWSWIEVCTFPVLYIYIYIYTGDLSDLKFRKEKIVNCKSSKFWRLGGSSVRKSAESFAFLAASLPYFIFFVKEVFDYFTSKEIKLSGDGSYLLHKVCYSLLFFSFFNIYFLSKKNENVTQCVTLHSKLFLKFLLKKNKLTN